MAKLEVKRIGYSAFNAEFIAKLRSLPEVSQQMLGCGGGGFPGWIEAWLKNPLSIFLMATIDGEFAGVMFGIPAHWNSYEGHQIYRPGRKFRQHVVELGKLAIAEFWRLASKNVTHVLGYTPAKNRPACLAARMMGFTEIGRIPEYAGDSDDVIIFLIRRG